MASPKQIHWIATCLADRVVPPDLCESANKVLAAGKNGHVGDLLTQLFACPKKAETAKPWMVLQAEYPGVPEGYYAVPATRMHADASPELLDFFVVAYGDSIAPKYAGRLFVKQVIGGQPNQRVSPERARALLGAVIDPVDDRTRFGLTLKRCPKCRQHLTDPNSRKVGWGKDCADANGIPHPGNVKKGSKAVADDNGTLLSV